MNNYLLVKKTQIGCYLKTPLYFKNNKGEFVLYKSIDTKIDAKRYLEDRYPLLYIPEEARYTAFDEVQLQLKKNLLKQIESGDLSSVKNALCEIMDESFKEPLNENLQSLPQTIDIIFNEYSGTTRLLNFIAGVKFGGTTLVEHSVNVMIVVLNYCLFVNFPEDKTKRLCLGALLHDIGLTQIPKRITEANRRLTNQEFSVYKTHPPLGHDIIKENIHIDSSIAVGVLEHHERLDGSGYPRGISNVSFDGGLIGLIDSFDSLSNTAKIHRRKESPFSAMKLIQDEILNQGKFEKTVFKDLCLSLLGKNRY